MSLKDDALRYHREPRPGKYEISPTKPLTTQYDLSLAYSPGVADPCREIAADSDNSFLYTGRGNLVAVITDGSAVLGLGNIGPDASKPVMEGKAVLFKKFAGIDSVDLELKTTNSAEFVATVAALEPSFGGINLEDIAAPACFEIERELKERLAIPVMHDDQHGTAIISAAALLNALELAEKSISEIRLAVIGAGAAAMACTRFYVQLGVKADHVCMFDRDGVVGAATGRANHEFAAPSSIRSLSDALDGADVLLGLSAGNILSADLITRMAERPIIFALANPDPEISWGEAHQARPDCIMATGRSDLPNQVNNVLGFPYIFRGALDVGSTEINDGMKIAAANALARLARDPVPDDVHRAYSATGLVFGPDYLIPKPLDPRLLTVIAPAVAKAAMETGVARKPIDDWARYEAELLERVGMGQKLITGVISQARRRMTRIVLPEATDFEVAKAAEQMVLQQIAEPVLVGSRREIELMIKTHGLDALSGKDIFDPHQDKDVAGPFAELLYDLRHRRGITRADATRLMQNPNYLGAALVKTGKADGLVSGRLEPYPVIIRPLLHIVGKRDTGIAGMYVVNTRRGVLFLADATVNVSPDEETVLNTIGLVANRVREFGHEPAVAMLSYSNFGSSRGDQPRRIARITERARERFPDLVIDGELQANVALDSALLQQNYPFSALAGKRVNTLIFPDLAAGNIAYKLLNELANVELIGPLLLGMNAPVHVVQMGASAREIVQITAVAAVEAQALARK